MKKIIILGISVFSFFLTAHLAFASLEITQVMYNPEVKANHLWIKVFNNDSNDVNLTDWYVMTFDGTSWHYHAINPDGSSTLSPNSYAVIADASASTISTFKSKNPDLTDSLFYGNLNIDSEGTMGLSNDKKNIIGKISYGGASTPTSDSSTDVISSNSSNSDTNTETKEKEPDVFKITAKILADKVFVAGVASPINSKITTNRRETYLTGNFVWNFGDGMSKNDTQSKSFDYLYQYPGDYVLTLDYYQSYGSFSQTPDASDRITIKVVPSDIVISSVGSGGEAYVEIQNKSSYEVNLSNWYLKSGNKSFLIPKGTMILAGKKIRLASKITGFDNFDVENVSLVYPNGEVISQFGVVTPKVSSIKSSGSYYPTSPTGGNSSSVNNNINNSTQNNSNIIDLNNLDASAGDANTTPSNTTFAYMGLVVILILGSGSVYFFRRRFSARQGLAEEEVESGMRAEDIRILE